MSRKDGRLMGWGWRIFGVWMAIIIIAGIITLFCIPSTSLPFPIKIIFLIMGLTGLGPIVWTLVGEWTDTSYKY